MPFDSMEKLHIAVSIALMSYVLFLFCLGDIHTSGELIANLSPDQTECCHMLVVIIYSPLYYFTQLFIIVLLYKHVWNLINSGR